MRAAARAGGGILWALVPLLAVVSAGVALGEEATPEEEGAPERETKRSRSIIAEFDCDICHTPEGWKVGPSRFRGKKAGFDHGAATGFELEGRHLGVPCMLCHKVGRSPAAECSGCHQDAHAGRLGRDCARCHRSTDWREIRAEELHSTTQFPLTGMHLLADCTECHRRRGERQFSSVPTDCYACHADDYRRDDIHPRHTGSPGSPPFPRDCSQCHRPTGWSPAVIDVATLPRRDGLTQRESHDARFPLSYGPHRDADCEDCHVTASVRRAVRCTGCHAHNTIRVRAIHGPSIGSPQTTRCLACHPGGIGR